MSSHKEYLDVKSTTDSNGFKSKIEELLIEAESDGVTPDPRLVFDGIFMKDQQTGATKRVKIVNGAWVIEDLA